MTASEVKEFIESNTSIQVVQIIGRVLVLFKISDEEAENLAQKKSELDPGRIYYVQYDDIMNPSSDTYWVNGTSYKTYSEALSAYRQGL